MELTPCERRYIYLRYTKNFFVGKNEMENLTTTTTNNISIRIQVPTDKLV